MLKDYKYYKKVTKCLWDFAIDYEVFCVIKCLSIGDANPTAQCLTLLKKEVLMKLLKNSLITILATFIILSIFPTAVFAKEYEPRLEAPNGEPYYTRELNAYSQTGYGMPNCVAYAYGRIYELNGEAPLITRGNAGEWWSININNGYYDYGSEPRLGAIACWSNHVAIVEAINEDGSVLVSESHWGGTYFDTKTFTNMSSHYGQYFYGYIYAYEPEQLTANDTQPQEITFSIEDSYYFPQEDNAFTALEFANNNNSIMNPTTNALFK